MEKTSTITTDLSPKIFTSTVLVTGLGYLVDVYDMWIFNVTRIPLLADLGLTGEAAMDAGLMTINLQLAGVLLGGLAFGIMGDKIGRKACLLGSILLYSLATLGCAYVQNVDQLMVLRFVAGFGLAGEVGVGVSLVTETISRERRGLGTMILVFLGIIGAIAAGWAATVFDWRTAFQIGGWAGLALLVLRAVVMESNLFNKTKATTKDRGNFLKILKTKRHVLNLIACICLGMPMFFIVGQVWTFGPEIASALGVSGVTAGKAFLYGNITMLLGDLLVGGLGQKMKSRKRPILIILTLMTAILLALILLPLQSANMYYVFCALLGITTGYWVNTITIAAELYGTNLRATAATSIPAFIRLNMIWQNLLVGALKGSIGVLASMAWVGVISVGLALIALWHLEETFGKDLDYHD